MQEAKLELNFVYALDSTSPLDRKKTDSISSLSIKGVIVPNLFQDLKPKAEEFFAYCQDRNPDLSYQDCLDYLAFRIWQYKLDDPSKRIEHPLCRNLGLLVAKNAIKEVHKSGSRVKRNANNLKEIIETKKESEHYQLLTEIRDLIEQESANSLMVYQQIIDTHKQIYIAIKESLIDDIKRLEGEDNG